MNIYLFVVTRIDYVSCCMTSSMDKIQLHTPTQISLECMDYVTSELFQFGKMTQLTKSKLS